MIIRVPMSVEADCFLEMERVCGARRLKSRTRMQLCEFRLYYFQMAYERVMLKCQDYGYTVLRQCLGKGCTGV